MPAPFSPRADDPSWIASVTDWIDRALSEVGLVRRSDPRRRYVRAWSILMTVETDAGPVWFKALCAPMRFEAALVPLVAGWVPDLVRAPIAAEPREGWLLAFEHAPALATAPTTATTDDWCTILRNVARLQQATLHRRAEILDTGAMDASLATVSPQFDELVAGLAGLGPEDPARLDEHEATAIVGARKHVIDAVARLSEAGLPHGLQHGDAHAGNVESGSLRLFDFGDAQWALAAESLVVPRRSAARSDAIDFSAVEHAYAQAWADVHDPALIGRHRDDIELVHEVNRAALWWRAMAQMTPEEWIAWGDSPKEHLLNVAKAAA